jgi:hypothetical protein
MKIFIELWKAKDAWKEMSLEDRQNYVGAIGPVMQDLISKGVVIDAWGLNEDKSEYRADYDFYAVTRFPSPELLSEFEAIVEGAGWYNYFEQVNITGDVSTPENVIGKMLEL